MCTEELEGRRRGGESFLWLGVLYSFSEMWKDITVISPGILFHSAMTCLLYLSGNVSKRG